MTSFIHGRNAAMSSIASRTIQRSLLVNVFRRGASDSSRINTIATPIVGRATTMSPRSLVPATLFGSVGAVSGRRLSTLNHEILQELRQTEEMVYRSHGSQDNILIARSLNDLGAVYYNTRQLEKASAFFERAVDLLRTHLFLLETSDQPKIEHRLLYSQILDNLTRCKIKMRVYNEALPFAQELLREVESISEGRETPERLAAQDHLALIHMELGRHETALSFAEASQMLRQHLFGEQSMSFGEGLLLLAHLAKRRFDINTSVDYYRKALALFESLQPNSLLVASVQATIASLIQDNQEIDTLLRSALSIRENFYGGNHPAVADSLRDLSLFLSKIGAFADSATLVERELSVRSLVNRPDHPLRLEASERLQNLQRQL